MLHQQGVKMSLFGGSSGKKNNMDSGGEPDHPQYVIS